MKSYEKEIGSNNKLKAVSYMFKICLVYYYHVRTAFDVQTAFDGQKAFDGWKPFDGRKAFDGRMGHHAPPWVSMGHRGPWTIESFLAIESCLDIESCPDMIIIYETYFRHILDILNIF